MSQTEFNNGAISPMKPKNTPSSPNEPTTIAPSVNGWNGAVHRVNVYGVARR